LKSEISTAESEQVLQHVANTDQKTISWLNSLSESKSAISNKIRTWIQKFQSKSEILTVTSELFDQQFSTHNMIKSSASASITHYKLQNAKRESLLTQNQTASEEDMNASSDTEQENMNTLFFNYKMIKISINTKLKTWIIAYEADNIIVFIQHMYHQHDIKIETHNDMI